MRLVHYSEAPVLSVYSVEQIDTKPFKPRGFWVSDDDCEDNWRAWCEAENFCLERLACVHDVALAPDANILRLASAYEIDAFTKQYGEPRRGSVYQCDWGRVASQYDGIIITPYIWARRLDGGADWYYSWDCASGCIWNARAIASITLRAQGIAAGTGETREAGLDAERKSPVGEADAPTSQERSHE